MKKMNGLKTVISFLAEEDKTNKSIISAFQYSQTTDATTDPKITAVKAPAPDQPRIVSLKSRSPSTLVKPQSIIQNNKNESIR